MDKVNPFKTAANPNIVLLLIQRLDAIQEQHNRQLDALKSELRAHLPEFHDQARYQKLRVICSSRKLMREFRDSGGKI